MTLSLTVNETVKWLSSPLPIFCCCHFDIDVCIYSTCTFFDCQADFDVDNVQRRELVNFYGV